MKNIEHLSDEDANEWEDSTVAHGDEGAKEDHPLGVVHLVHLLYVIGFFQSFLHLLEELLLFFIDLGILGRHFFLLLFHLRVHISLLLLLSRVLFCFIPASCPSRLLLRLLVFLYEFGIEAVWERLQNLLVISLFDDLTLAHHNDVVSMPDGGESVGDHYSGDGSKVLADLIDGILDFLLVLFVQSTCCLIKKEDLWFLNKGSSDGYSLLLTA